MRPHARHRRPRPVRTRRPHRLKAAPAALGGDQWAGTPFVDASKRNRAPSPNELMAELKGTAWACASINAAVCATFPPSVYVATRDGDPAAKYPTRRLKSHVEDRLRKTPWLAPRLRKAARLEEVTDGPLVNLLATANPVHNGFDLWELTDLYLEVHGKAFCYLAVDPFLGVPAEIWPLPAQNVAVDRKPGSPNLIDGYEYRSGAQTQTFAPDEVIFFRFPDPRDPYLGGLSPLRAVSEQVSMAGEYAAYRKAVYENRAVPDAIVSPAEVVGEVERDRLEAEINQKFRRGGAGCIMVAESSMRVDILSRSMGDLAALADRGGHRQRLPRELREYLFQNEGEW